MQRRLELEPLSGVELTVMDFRVEEALDEPYVVRVDFWIADAERDPLTLLGGNGALILERADRIRRFTGFVRTVREGAATLEGGEATGIPVQIELVPALWALSLRRQSRIFQELDATEILQRVLEEALGDCVADPIRYEARSTAVAAESLRHLDRAHATTTTAVAIRDFDFTNPSRIVEAEASGEDAVGRTRESYEHGWGRSATIWAYDPGVQHYGQNDAERAAAVRREAARARQLVGVGRTTILGLLPGATFELVGHPSVGFDGEYLITRVRHHTGGGPGDAEGSAGITGYENEIECVPLDVPHRPARRPELAPRIPSVQTAIVTGPAGEEIHTDEYGRVKVHFHWDRENAPDDKSSCWVRVQQKWAGSGWGFWWLPRVGMEVVVQFIDGDPDRPLVTGAVYDGNAPTPYALPDDKTKSTIKSSSTPGGGGFNELRFEDAAGDEQIYVHAQRDYDEVVENDHTTTVHHDQDNTVDDDQRQTVHNDQTENVGVDQTMTVDGDRTVHVEGSYDETVDGTETRTVTGDVSESFGAGETRTVSADLTESIGADETRTVGGNQQESFGGNETRTVGGASNVTITGSLTQTVAGGVSLETPAAWDLTATGGLTIVAAAGIKLDAAGGWKVSAPGGVTQIDAGKDWTGFFWRSSGAFSRGVAGGKFEKFGATFTYVNTKVGITGAAMPQLGTKIEFNTAAFGTIGGKITMAGADVHTWGMEMDN